MMAFIFDTETTGLIENRLRKIDKQSEIIEFYGCLANLETGEIIHDYETFIKPKAKRNEETMKKTRSLITDKMLAEAPSFAEVADTIRDNLEHAPMIIAHNAAFDKEIVDIEMERINQVITWPRTLCTIEQTMHLKGCRLSLTNLHEFLFGEPFSDAHRAKHDCLALLRCCVELKKQGAI